MDLETPVAAPAEPVAPPAPPPEPPAPPAEPEPEGTVEVSGQRLAPVSAVIGERKARQEAERQLASVQAAVAQVQPYIEFLQRNPNFMQQPQAPPAAPAPPAQDEAAVQLARMLDLYTPDGQPDAARAILIRKTMREEARQEAQTIVKPVQEGSLRERANAMYQRALVTQTPDGRKPDPQILTKLFQNADPSIASTEEGAAGIVAMAIGLTALTTAAAPAPPGAPPLVTEAPGGRFTNTGKAGPLDAKVMEMRGIDQKTYAERVRGFTPGVSNVLED